MTQKLDRPLTDEEVLQLLDVVRGVANWDYEDHGQDPIEIARFFTDRLNSDLGALTFDPCITGYPTYEH